MADILLSFPRTGSSWTRYILEYFSGQCVDGYYDKKSVNETIEQNGFEPLFDVDRQKIFCTMVHDHVDIRGIDRLCLSYRDPVEVIPSYCYSDNHANKATPIEDFLSNLTADRLLMSVSRYASAISYFKNFDGEKHLLDYDQLMNDPDKAIKGLTSFFGVASPRKQKAFMKNYDEHKNIMLSYKSMPKHMSVNTSGKTGVIADMLPSDVKLMLESVRI